MILTPIIFCLYDFGYSRDSLYTLSEYESESTGLGAIQDLSMCFWSSHTSVFKMRIMLG